MKQFLKNVLYGCPPLRRSVVRLRDWVETSRYNKRYAERIQADKGRILFCAYSGRQYACSPKALYLYLKGREEGFKYQFVWALRDPEQFPELAAEKDTTVVRYGSEEFYEEAARCGYWVFNTRVPTCMQKKEDQVYVQTWHGTPFKKLGFDVEHYISGADDKKSLRRSYATDAVKYDYLLSPSLYYSEKMSSAFHLKELGKEGCLLEEGYPRNDRLYTASEEDIAKIRESLGISPGEKVVLYAPTWRENALDPKSGSTYGNGIAFHLGLDLKRLLDEVGENTKVLVRTHYFVSDQIRFSDYGGRLLDVSRYPDINDLYLASDVLLTDYSSVLFDYSILERPIVFYMYDLESYQNVRDFYFPPSRLPGPVVTKEEELYPVLRQALAEGGDLEKIREFNRVFNPMPGPSSERVWDAIERDKRRIPNRPTDDAASTS